MAQHSQVHLVDDLTGDEAQETVRFSLDGVSYEIDLTRANAEALRTVLARFVAAGRRSGSSRPAAGGRVTRSIIDAYNESR